MHIIPGVESRRAPFCSFLLLFMCKSHKVNRISSRILHHIKFYLSLSYFTVGDLFFFLYKTPTNSFYKWMQSTVNIWKNVNAWKLPTLQFTCCSWKEVLGISVRDFQIGGKAMPFHNHNVLMKEFKIYTCIQICRRDPWCFLPWCYTSSVCSHLVVHYPCNVTGKTWKLLLLNTLLEDPNIKSNQQYFSWLCKQLKLLLVEKSLSLNHQTRCISQQMSRY